MLLVEAGGEPRSLFIRVPAGFGHLLRSRRYNWGYESAPDPDTDGRAIPVPSGRGLGGSGLINGMVYVRGQAADYDGWAAAGAMGWAHADVEPYFRRIEDYAQGGRGGGAAGRCTSPRFGSGSPWPMRSSGRPLRTAAASWRTTTWSREGSATTRSTSSEVADGARTTRIWLPSAGGRTSA